MDYYNIYVNLINKSKIQKLNGYYEKHHMIHRCIGGTDDKSNLVKMTAKQHYVAHLLLCKIFPNEIKLINAYLMMSNRLKISSNKYEQLKKKFSNYMSVNNPNKHGRKQSEHTKEKIRQWNIGRKHSLESKKKMSIKAKGSIPYNSGINMKQEQKEKISKSLKGRKLSEDHKKKLSNINEGSSNPSYGKEAWNKGKKLKALTCEHKKKISEALRKKNAPL